MIEINKMKTNIAFMACQTFLEEVPNIQREIQELVDLPPLGEGTEYRDIKASSDHFPANYLKYQVIDWRDEDGDYVGTTQRLRSAEITTSKYRIKFLCVLSPEELTDLHSNLERIAKESPLHNGAVFRLIHIAGTSGDLGARVYDKQDENTILASKEYIFKKILFGGK